MKLCIFTNCTNDCLSRPTITATYQSFLNTFGLADSLTVYYDPRPNEKDARDYLQALYTWFGIENVVVTNGLAHGYRKALESPDDYLFMLEHDWIFKNVSHKSNELIDIMKRDNLWFMLFNKHSNNEELNGTIWQSYFKDNGEYCLTDRVSNNPHIINRKYYRDNIMHLVNWTIGGAGMIEQTLQKKHDIAVYGKYGLEPTIKHINGRRGGKK